MERKFKFTNERIKALPANPPDAKGTDLEFSDTEVIGLKCLSGRTANKPWLLHYSTSSGRKSSIAIGRFPDIDVSRTKMLCCLRTEIIYMWKHIGVFQAWRNQDGVPSQLQGLVQQALLAHQIFRRFAVS